MKLRISIFSRTRFHYHCKYLSFGHSLVYLCVGQSKVSFERVSVAVECVVVNDHVDTSC